jgi:hypothetical protein
VFPALVPGLQVIRAIQRPCNVITRALNV